jgi:hypothetical protein
VLYQIKDVFHIGEKNVYVAGVAFYKRDRLFRARDETRAPYHDSMNRRKPQPDTVLVVIPSCHIVLPVSSRAYN